MIKNLEDLFGTWYEPLKQKGVLDYLEPILKELQALCKGAMDATCMAIEAHLKLHLLFDGEIEAFQELGQKWLDDCADSINTMYADAAQRFVTVH